MIRAVRNPANQAQFEGVRSPHFLCLSFAICHTIPHEKYMNPMPKPDKQISRIVALYFLVVLVGNVLLVQGLTGKILYGSWVCGFFPC